MRRLVIIDGKSVFYRGYYAMGNLSLSDGTPTGGVYGFAAIAMEIVKKLKPNKVVVAWDSPSSTAKRKAIYAEYKAGRVKPGEDFYAQIPLLIDLIKDLGWDFVELDNYEADDIIGTLSREADEVMDANGNCEYETFIISSDLDMLQIVDENTHMWRILKGFSNIEQIDVAEIEAKYGIKKTQFLDLKALKGDASDNIPGVPGVGEKTAVKLLNEYGTLDAIYENLDKITGATRAKLEAGKESAFMSRTLAKIQFDAPVELEKLPDFVFDKERVVQGLRKLEFKSLIRKIGGEEILQNINSEEVEEEIDIDIDMPVPPIIGWDIKAMMHADEKLAKRIEDGEGFWDLQQAAFLINPLAREEPQLFEPEKIYKEQMAKLMRMPRLYDVLMKLDLPTIPVLYRMEKCGMKIDARYFEALRKEYEAQVAEIEKRIWKLVDVEFNINSPVQLSEVLFDILKLPVKGIKKTSRGYSTGAKELEKLSGLHPVVDEIIKYREAVKLLTTYIVPMPGFADENDRIHTTFTQNVTATGRLSSLNPNLQNIPVRTDAGKRIRAGFVAEEGKMLVSADYSQFELRLAAVLANDTALIEDFNSGIDIHTKTAAEAFGVPFDEVTKAQRRSAKVINFGVLYGMSVKGLSDAAGMPIAEAKEFIDNYFKLRAPIKKMLDGFLEQAKDKGYVETYFGRRRPTPDVKSTNFLIRQAAERAAQNMPIQGTEADLMKRAMIKVDAKLPKGAELIMQVHDSLIVECDMGLVEEVKEVLQETMEGIAPELAIKLAVDVTVGQNWGEL